MSDEKWTPGPWEAMNEGWVAGPEDCENVAQALPWNFVGSQEIQTANAHLIAAAPDIAEELRKAVQLARIASDCNLDEVEIDGKMVPTYTLIDSFDVALDKARGKT